MNPTATLLRKDLRWAGPLALLGLIGHLIALASDGVKSLWIFPDAEWGLMNISYYAVAAGVLGLISAAAEELTRTREYLLHRPVSQGRIFWTRQALLVGVLIGWAVLTPTLHLAGSHLFSRNAALIDDSRWLLRVCEGLPALLFYALAVFCMSVTRSWWAGLLLTGAAGFAAWGLLLAMAFTDSLGASGSLAVLAYVLASAPLLVAALQCQRQGRDPDCPWTAQRLRRAGPPLLLLVAIMASASLTFLHAAGVAGLYELYANVTLHQGRFMLRKWDRDIESNRRLDERHQMQEALPENTRDVFDRDHPPWDRLERPFWESREFPGEGSWFRGHRYSASYPGPHRRAFFSSDGYVYLYQLSSEWPSKGRVPSFVRKLGKGPQQVGFSPQARVLSEDFHQHAVVHDPADRGLWHHDLRDESPAFVRRELPGGDSYLGPDEAWVMGTVRDRIMYPDRFPLRVLGQRGRYAFTGDEWQVLPPLPAQPDDPDAVKVSSDVQYLRAGHMHVVLRSPEGKELFRHLYRPHTLLERLAQILVEGPTLLRPLPLAAAGMLGDPGRAYRPGPTLLLDPAVALGSRLTLGGNLLLTLLLAGLSFRRLGRLGAPGGRRSFWLVAVLLGGLPAYLCYRLIETERAWRPLAKPAEAKPNPVRVMMAA